MWRHDSVPRPLPITFIVSADILYRIMQWLIRRISIWGEYCVDVCSTVCIEGQKRLNICLGVLLTSEDDVNSMRARHSSGLPLKTGTRHVFQFNDVVFGVFERKYLVNSVVCGHDAVATGLPIPELLNLFSGMRDDDLTLGSSSQCINFTAFLVLFHQLNVDMLKHMEYWFIPGLKDRGVERFGDI